MPKGHTVRKVRASQGRIADNVSRRRLPGKCNRNRPPALRRVRMERRGKSSPVSMVTWIRCKPYPKQHRMGIVCPTHIPGWHAAKAAERRGDAPQRQMVVHDRTRLTGKVAQSTPDSLSRGCFVLRLLRGSGDFFVESHLKQHLFGLRESKEHRRRDHR